MAKHSTIDERERRKRDRGLLYCNKRDINGQEKSGKEWCKEKKEKEYHDRRSVCNTLTLILKETVQQLRVLLNPEHPLFGVLPYAELLACLCDPCLHPLHPDQLLLTESAWDFINL